jgi:tripartite-type tricarboxylate transporter receptor subunit TctC
MYAPQGLPAAVLQRLERAVASAVNRPDFRSRLIQLGIAPVGSTSAELATAQARDLARWEKPIKATGVQLD